MTLRKRFCRSPQNICVYLSPHFVILTDERVQKGYTDVYVSSDFAGIKRKIKKQAALFQKSCLLQCYGN